jgi:hypothetical protein
MGNWSGNQRVINAWDAGSFNTYSKTLYYLSLIGVQDRKSALKADDPLTHDPLFPFTLKLKNFRSFSHQKQSIIISFIPTQLSQPNSMP